MLCATLGFAATTLARPGYEVWAIDQSNSPGVGFGGTLYIWDGKDLEDMTEEGPPTPEAIDLSAASASLCILKTGANPVRPHMTGADAHGAGLTKHQRYLWVADRGRNFLWVVDTTTDDVVGTNPLETDFAPDPTPDLIVLSPNGSHAFISLRGPNPLTADPHVSTGSTPGVGVLKVTKGGRNAKFEAVARVTNLDTSGTERADVHALTLRTTR